LEEARAAQAAEEKSKGSKKILQERKERLKRPLLNFKKNKKKQQPH